MQKKKKKIMPLEAQYKGFKDKEKNWLNALIERDIESIMSVEINDAWLEIDVATPHEVTNALLSLIM